MTGKRFERASDLRTLEEGLPTGPDDVAALRRRARERSWMTPVEVARMIERLGPWSLDDLSSRPPLDGEPFDLRADPGS